MPLKDKIAKADAVIDGTWSFEQTKNEVERLVSAFTPLA
jgi:dephospho-CoA kinase